MARYIDADELYKKIFPLDVVDKRRYSINAKAVAEAIVDMPTADVAPRAEWISADNPPKTYRDEYGELIPFLVCCRGTVHPFRAMYDGKNWGDGIGRLNVTHWMPLPEPPVMKGGAE